MVSIARPKVYIRPPFSLTFRLSESIRHPILLLSVLNMLFYVLILTILRFAFCVHGAVLPHPEPRPVGNEGLAKRVYPANSVTGYPVKNDCTGTDHYTFTDLTLNTVCYNMPSNVSFSSVKITDFSEPIGIYAYFDQHCQDYGAMLVTNTGEDKCLDMGYEFASFSLVTIEPGELSFPLLRHFANCQLWVQHHCHWLVRVRNTTYL
jgi:hypothetical protein